VSRLAIALLLIGCTARGPNRDGAVAITAHLALRPGADGEAWVRDVADAIGNEQLQRDELTANGERSPRVLPRIEVTPNPIYSDHMAPLQAMSIRASDRDVLAQALARAKESRRGEADVVPVYERDGDGWQLYFVHSLQGFELTAGAMAKVVEEKTDAGPEHGVVIFLADEDAPRFEQLTRDHLGRRIALVSGDESLMNPVVRDVMPGGTVWITPGQQQTADELLARLVR
jgi:hypothetical protein